jgi:hypothetical protein
MELGDGLILGADGENGGPDGFEEDEHVGREVVVGVLQHQVSGKRAHVTDASVGNLGFVIFVDFDRFSAKKLAIYF